MKIKGSELALFLNEAWPDDFAWDHDLFEDEPDPDETYDTDELGGLHYAKFGSPDDPTNGDGYSLAGLIRQWRKARKYDVFTVTCPKDQTEAVKALIATSGARVST